MRWDAMAITPSLHIHIFIKVPREPPHLSLTTRPSYYSSLFLLVPRPHSHYTGTFTQTGTSITVHYSSPLSSPAHVVHHLAPHLQIVTAATNPAPCCSSSCYRCSLPNHSVPYLCPLCMKRWLWSGLAITRRRPNNTTPPSLHWLLSSKLLHRTCIPVSLTTLNNINKTFGHR